MSTGQPNNPQNVTPLHVQHEVDHANINTYIVLEKYKKYQHYLNKLLLVSYNNDEIENRHLTTKRFDELKKLEQEDRSAINAINLKIIDLSKKIKQLDDPIDNHNVIDMRSYRVKDTSNIVSRVNLTPNNQKNATAVSADYWNTEYKQYYERLKQKKEQLEKEEQLRKEALEREKELNLKQQQDQSMFTNPLMGLYGMDLDLNFGKPDHHISAKSIATEQIPQDSFLMGSSNILMNQQALQNDVFTQNNQQDKPEIHQQPVQQLQDINAADNDFLINDFEFDDLDLNNDNDFANFNDDELDPAFF